LVAVATLLAAASGCGGTLDDHAVLGGGDSGDSDDADWQNYYNTSDEKPGFGDPEILAMTEDAPWDDPYAGGDQPQALAAAIYLRVLWGNLTLAIGERQPLNYSGSIAIDDGVLVVQRTIAFEPGDAEIEAREDPTHVVWWSVIGPHYDGLALLLTPGQTPEDQNLLHVTIGPFTADYSVAELRDLLLVEPSGYEDDNVAIVSQESDGATRGFIFGHWRDVERARGGVFKGKWESASGSLIGHERCRYLPEGDGAGELRGKSIDLDGHFRGLLRGEYHETGGQPARGEFDGDWLDADLTTLGGMRGVYVKDGPRGMGFALGTWFAE
jgi:hypothetical protein